MQLCKNVVLGLLAAFPIICSAANWQSVAFSRGSVYYMDFDSITPFKQYIKAWIGIQYPEPQLTDTIPGKQYQNEKVLYYFSCKQKSFAITTFTLYGVGKENNQVVDTFSSPFDERKLRDIPPESVVEQLITPACDATSRKKILADNETVRKAIEDAKKEAGIKR